MDVGEGLDVHRIHVLMQDELSWRIDLRIRLFVEAKLVQVIASPDVEAPAIGQGDGVAVAASHVNDEALGEGLDLARPGLERHMLLRLCWGTVAKLAAVVLTPRVHGTGVGGDDGMPVRASNLRHRSLLKLAQHQLNVRELLIVIGVLIDDLAGKVDGLLQKQVLALLCFLSFFGFGLYEEFLPTIIGWE